MDFKPLKWIVLKFKFTYFISLSYSKQIKLIAIIAEGIPENMTKKINKLAVEKGVSIVGPATVGGVKPGCFKIGNTGIKHFLVFLKYA